MSAGRPRSESSRAAILAAAVELLEEGGWGTLTVEGVARRAELTEKARAAQGSA